MSADWTLGEVGVGGASAEVFVGEAAAGWRAG